VSNKGNLRSLRVFFVLAVSLVTFLGMSTMCRAQDGEASCLAAKEHWEKVLQELKDKVNDYATVYQTPVERITQRPIIEKTEGKTIARQISEALQVKEDLLNAKRKECRGLLEAETQAFSDFQSCLVSGKSVKDKEVKNLAKKRQSVLEKALLAISEVREVEGQDTSVPYSEAMRDQDPYRRSVNNYWQSYQQMYRRWWGQ
jgi:hypothetical protein